MSTEWLLLVLALGLIAANAAFVAAEFSLVTVDRAAVEAAASEQRRAARVLRALRSLSTQLSGAQLGITITSLLVGFLAEPSLASLLSGPLQSWGLAETTAGTASVLLALLIATVVQMVLGELVPKNWAIAAPLAVAQRVAPLQMGFTGFARPLISFLNGNANAILRRFGVEPREELASARSAEELQSLLRHSAQAGTLDKPVATLLDRSLSFGERIAADVLTPRTKVHFVDADAPVAEVIELARVTGHSRFPVVGLGGADDIEGVVGLRRVLRIPPERAGTVRVREVLDNPVLVPETLPLDDLLGILRRRAHLAVVVDEYGGTAGVVTLEDLVEELVGEVQDESDRPVDRIRRRRDGSLVLSGLLRPDEAREHGVPAPDGEWYETLGGLTAARLGRIPSVGDSFRLEGCTLTVERMDGRRVDLISARAEPAPSPDSTQPDGGTPGRPHGGRYE